MNGLWRIIVIGLVASIASPAAALSPCQRARELPDASRVSVDGIVGRLGLAAADVGPVRQLLERLATRP